MSDLTKAINRFFASATKTDVENLLKQIILSERQSKIFEMFYLKKHDICFIADYFNISQTVINRELARIRLKVNKVL